MAHLRIKVWFSEYLDTFKAIVVGKKSATAKKNNILRIRRILFSGALGSQSQNVSTV